MSEPVAWLSDDGRVITAESKLSLPKSLANFRIPLYAADAIERKDAAIAELLAALYEIEGGGGVQGEIATAAIAKAES